MEKPYIQKGYFERQLQLRQAAEEQAKATFEQKKADARAMQMQSSREAAAFNCYNQRILKDFEQDSGSLIMYLGS